MECLPVLLSSNSMNYDSEILYVLKEAGAKGLSIRKIARHVFNSRNSLFDVVSFDDVHRYVAGYLARSSKSEDSFIERTDVRGVYRLNLSNASRQLQFDFKDEDGEFRDAGVSYEDKSLSLF